MTDEPESFTLKEALFNPETVAAFADALCAVYPPFARDAFLGAVFDESWAGRALMDRMRHVTTALRGFLPGDYRAALRVLLDALPSIEHGGFVAMVPSDFVAAYGLDDPDAWIPALEVFTQAISAEFSVRPFIVRYPDRLLAQMLAWADHPSSEVRRLASEGCRPRLPWGLRLHGLVAAPAPILPILDKLKHDESESVRRSVANNLNDISKDHPGLVVDVLRRWQAAEPGDEQIRWITGHALRTLVKRGDPAALELLGYPAAPQITVRDVQVTPGRIAIGEKVTLTFTVESTASAPQALIVDYVVYHMKANGEQTPKVFKLKTVTLQPGEMIMLRKNHSFQPVTTRKYYPGAHAIAPQINGQGFARADFELTV